MDVLSDRDKLIVTLTMIRIGVDHTIMDALERRYLKEVGVDDHKVMESLTRAILFDSEHPDACEKIMRPIRHTVYDTIKQYVRISDRDMWVDRAFDLFNEIENFLIMVDEVEDPIRDVIHKMIPLVAGNEKDKTDYK